MKGIVLSLFGSYEPVTTLASDGVTEIVASGFAGVDWPWLVGAGLFAICLYSVFRLVGVLLRG